MTTSTKPQKPRIVRCPTCGGPSVYGPENPFRPFCSKRCKLRDLGAWASEQYRVEDGGRSAGDGRASERDHHSSN